jgi:hypothetical protein
MPIGFYARLEPRTRSDDLAVGLAARVYDPAWMLTRQWQLGELGGDDSGSPVRVRHTGTITWCTTYRDRGGDRAVPPGAGPVEARAEAAPAPPDKWTARQRVDIGRALLRAVRDASLGDRIPALLAAFPLTPSADPADPAAGLLAVAAGRVPDGRRAFEQLAGPLRQVPPALPALPGLVVDGDLLAAAAAWLASCDALRGTPPGGAWDAERMEHTFTIAAPGPQQGLAMHANAHSGGALDWWAFDAEPLPAAPDAHADEHDTTTIPTRVTFRGMPTPRWWQEEDASIDLGGVEANPADLARMAVLQFALVYGNDQFVVPVRLPVGTVFRTTHLLVTDTFGMTTAVEPAAHTGPGGRRAPGAERWTMFTLTQPGPAGVGAGVADAFVLPATAMHRLTSTPVEQVLLLRDEMANLGWAVEQVVEGGDGAPLRRSERWHQPPATEPPAAGPLRYQLATTVPPYWFPLVPQRTDSGDTPTLTVELMAHSDDPGAVPLGTFLHTGLAVADDRLPREGRRLVSDRVLARWSDGSTVAWRRRRTTVGRGEGSSGLRFDSAEPGYSTS